MQIRACTRKPETFHPSIIASPEGGNTFVFNFLNSKRSTMGSELSTFGQTLANWDCNLFGSSTWFVCIGINNSIQYNTVGL